LFSAQKGCGQEGQNNEYRRDYPHGHAFFRATGEAPGKDGRGEEAPSGKYRSARCAFCTPGCLQQKYPADRQRQSGYPYDKSRHHVLEPTGNTGDHRALFAGKAVATGKACAVIFLIGNIARVECEIPVFSLVTDQQVC